MFIIDAQVHLWQRDSPDRPWPRDRSSSYVPQPENLPPTTLQLMDDAGVDRAVIVPPIWAGDDNVPQLNWCTQYPARFGVMGRFDLWDPDRARIDTWLDQRGMLGIRMSYPSDRGRTWLDVDEFSWFWSATERLGVPIMLLVQGEEVDALRPIAQRHPELRLIVDHFGLRIGDPHVMDPFEHVDATLALAIHPNVFVKLSALPAYTVEEYPYPAMTPFLRRAFDAFGPQRLMWGSDASRVTRATYIESLDHVRDSLEFLDDADKAWILGNTAASVLNWPE